MTIHIDAPITASSAAVVTAALLLASGCSTPAPPGPGTGAERPAPHTLPVPPEPVRDGTPFYPGVFLGGAVTTPGEVRAAVTAFARRVGGHPPLVKSFHVLSSDFSPTGWAGQLLREVRAAESVNYVALGLEEAPGAETERVLGRIVEGGYDARLRAVAEGMRQFGDVVLLEPGWEMNGDWAYDWQGVYNNPEAPEKYRQAWRHIVNVFRSAGATNVRFVFNPNTGNPVTNRDTGPGHWNWYGHYYPGDDYVDYIGVHAFNAPSLWRTRWRSLENLLTGPDQDRTLTSMLERIPGKPVIIGEMASEEGEDDEDKAGWIRDAYRFMTDHPRIVGAVWFDTDKEVDWRIASSDESLAAYREALAHPWVVTVFTDPAGR